MKVKNLIIIFVGCLFLVSCSNSDRPKMSNTQKDKGVIQEINIAGVESSAENFRKTSREIFETNKKILNKNKSVDLGSRRVSITTNSTVPSLSIIDHNSLIKNLDNTLVTFKFNDISLRSALKLFASTVKKNIIIGNEVQGNLTVDFDNIKWGSAVYAILDMNSLVMTIDKKSDLLRVHTAEQFAILEKSKIDQTLQINKNLASLGSGGTSSVENLEENTITEIFKVFFQTSSEIIPPLTAAVGEGIEISDDPANNQLIVTASLQNLDKVDLVIQQLDIEKKQVMIEAYIISVTDNFTKAFNANLQTVNKVQQRAGRDGITYSGISTNPNESVAFVPLDKSSADLTDLQTTATQSIAGGAFLLGNLGITKLKVVIQSSITNNNSETISNPKLFAMDGETSTLVQGATLLKVIAAAGEQAGSIEKVPQNLSISVTPRIIGNGKVKIVLALSNDSPGTAQATETVTDTESITSTIQLDNGDVAILGGVYKNVRTDNNQFVPFLSQIPIIGSFFKQKAKSDSKRQLLIFLSANIV